MAAPRPFLFALLADNRERRFGPFKGTARNFAFHFHDQPRLGGRCHFTPLLSALMGRLRIPSLLLT
jgi:hypothetical protein